MFNFFANIFGYLLDFIYNLVNNYGLAIILFTVALKLIMLPFSIKQQKTMKKTQKIQEQSKIIQEKYKNDQVRMNQEIMDLYKQENMSPFGGCLTSILQFIVLISVFYMVSRPLTYMKHVDKTVLDGYVQTIVEENDGNRVNYEEIAVIKRFSAEDENVNINMDFFGLDLSDIPSDNYLDFKVYIIPALYVITSLISTKIAMPGASKKEEKEEVKEIVVEEAGDDPKKAEEKEEELMDEDAMAAMNKQMSIMMPAMSVMIALIAPLGLALYWLISNIFMLAERLLVNILFKDNKEEENG